MVGFSFNRGIYMDVQEIIRKELQHKRSDYVHFDYRESLNNKVWNYITDPAKIRRLTGHPKPEIFFLLLIGIHGFIVIMEPC